MNTLILLVATLTGAADARTTVLIEDVPHVRQKPDFCGEACAEMFLRKLGHAGDQDFVFDQSGLDPLLGRGCYTKDLDRGLRQIGFKTGNVWQQVAVKQASRQLDVHFGEMYRDLKTGVPSIVCMRYDSQPKTTEHFRLVLGYDSQTDEVVYHEPAVDDAAYRRMLRKEFLDLWPLKYAPDEWTVIRLRLEPGRLAAVPSAEGFTDADYAQHVLKLKERLPSEEFSIVLQKPFVVVGDEPLETVKSRAKNTVQWAVERLKSQYFDKDPAHILDVWLFRDSVSYEENAEKLFGSKPTTPYGYYSSKHKSLVMNIATGGGTLVHEIVHPFIATNFPDCPSWFNEGLASLYEASAEREGKIVGLTNWRLKGLQTAIGKDKVPPFETLCSTTRHEFYDEDPGTNYSQARYLCYYLQERGLLGKFYTRFRENAAEDPSGYKTLQEVLKQNDMAAFQKRWEAWIKKLVH